MNPNPITEVQKFGQSLWLDNISRGMITSGELQSLIDQGMMGMTSNPTIFEKAIVGSKDYDSQLEELAREGKGVAEITDELMIRDVQMAADVFLPVFDRTQGRDGFVSIEVNPGLAYQTKETVEAVKKLHRRVARKNVMIKVPGTPEGIPAFKELTGQGISINVTLIFSIETYEKVALAYVGGLKLLREKSRPLGEVRSVASVFVSRIDTLVDKKLQEGINDAPDAESKKLLQSLLGKVAVANSKLIYRKYLEIFGTEEFKTLQRDGAHVQRPLWGSTGTKNPKYSDILYVEELIGEDTVNTIPSQTLAFFSDHGKARSSIKEDLDTANETLEKLEETGIDLEGVTRELQKQGVRAFKDSHEQLTDRVAAKQRLVLGGQI